MAGNKERMPEETESVPKMISKVEISSKWTKTERTAVALLINRDLEIAISNIAWMDQTDPAYKGVEQTITALKSLVKQVWNSPSEELEAKRNLFQGYLV